MAIILDDLLKKGVSPEEDQKATDKARITKKQALYISHMCETIREFLMNHPMVFSEARASRIINALKPSYMAVMAMRKKHDEVYDALRDASDDLFEDDEALSAYVEAFLE